jgi:hypothetical protein
LCVPSVAAGFHTLRVQCLRNSLREMTFGVHLEHPPDCGSLALDYFELKSHRLSLASVAKYAAASVARFQRTTLHSTVSFQAQVTGYTLSISPWTPKRISS